MEDKIKFFGGDLVFVLPAPESPDISELPASVCGNREIEGKIMYLVEFSDGSTLELPDDRLVKSHGNALNNSLPLRDLN